MGNKTKCVKENTKKYKTRPSPPFPANKCKGKTKKGNNGKMFKSKPDVNGVSETQGDRDVVLSVISVSKDSMQILVK